MGASLRESLDTTLRSVVTVVTIAAPPLGMLMGFGWSHKVLISAGLTRWCHFVGMIYSFHELGALEEQRKQSRAAAGAADCAAATAALAGAWAWVSACLCGAQALVWASPCACAWAWHWAWAWPWAFAATAGAAPAAATSATSTAADLPAPDARCQALQELPDQPPVDEMALASLLSMGFEHGAAELALRTTPGGAGLEDALVSLTAARTLDGDSGAGADAVATAALSEGAEESEEAAVQAAIAAVATEEASVEAAIAAVAAAEAAAAAGAAAPTAEAEAEDKDCLAALRAQIEELVQEVEKRQQDWSARFSEMLGCQLADAQQRQQAVLQAQAEEAARLAEEQRAFRAELAAMCSEASRKQREGQEAFDDLQSQVMGIAAMQEQHQQALAALAERPPVGDAGGAAEARGWPLVRVCDVGAAPGGPAKHVRIECPGAGHEHIAFYDLGNGVRVHIAAPDGSGQDFERDICFDHRTDGNFELRADECWYDNGVLTLILRRTSPKLMRLNSAGRASLAPVLEEAASGHDQAARPRPMYFNIASEHDSQSIASELQSWTQVDRDSGAAVAWPRSEIDATSESPLESLAEGVPPPPPLSTVSAPQPALAGTRSSRASPAASAAASAVSLHSVASAPARGTTPCCFLPETAFRRAETGRYVRAAELKRAGGDKLLGPDGVEVLVRSAIKHAAVERDLVRFRLLGVGGAFVVTTDHRLLTKAPSGQRVTCLAGDFARGDLRYLFNGTDFIEVVLAELLTQSCQVVELSFEGDAVALAWVLPRRSRSGGARLPTPVAVPGKEPTPGDLGLFERATFVDLSVPDPQGLGAGLAGRRSRSWGAEPARGSSWSVGTEGHDDRRPELCQICTCHQFYLKGLRGPNASKAKPCPAGAGCRKCHAPHPEWRRGGCGALAAEPRRL